MRGKVTIILVMKLQNRITPAYAGKSVCLVHKICYMQDHPRLCGEKFLTRNSQTPEKGSPPPMRGKVDPKKINDYVIRITPAYAGKSALHASWQCLLEDHPRLCGEKLRSGTVRGTLRGSPPPMRGKGPPRRSEFLHTRITPAYAGKSGMSFMFAIREEDHPRLCGEKICAIVLHVVQNGSPPPMRGKVVMSGGYIEQTRITPAYAGKSFSLRRRGHEMWDHPRLCGEKPLFTGVFQQIQGSPPPMRGKVFLSVYL